MRIKMIAPLKKDIFLQTKNLEFQSNMFINTFFKTLKCSCSFGSIESTISLTVNTGHCGLLGLSKAHFAIKSPFISGLILCLQLKWNDNRFWSKKVKSNIYYSFLSKRLNSIVARINTV